MSVLNRKIIILIGGLPGTGKTYLAKAIASELNAIHLSSDAIRMKQGKLGKYKKGDKDSIYTKLKEELKAFSEKNNVIIVDTTFSKRQLRKDIIEIATSNKFEWFCILTTASEQIIKERTSKKRADSEADYKVYELIKSEFEPFTIKHLELNTDSESINQLIEKVISYCKVTND